MSNEEMFNSPHNNPEQEPCKWVYEPTNRGFIVFHLTDESEPIDVDTEEEAKQIRDKFNDYSATAAELSRVKQENEHLANMLAEAKGKIAHREELNKELAEVVQTVVDRDLVAGALKEECIAALTKHKGE